MRSDAILRRLTPAEWASCAAIGAQRTLDSIYNNRRRRRHLPDEDATGADVRGACSEFIVSEYTELPWPLDVGRFGAPDVGDNVHVRSTRHLSGHLILRDDDEKLDEPHVLVVGPYPNLWMVGWAFGREVRQPELRNRADDSWWMPPGDLRPMNTIHGHVISNKMNSWRRRKPVVEQEARTWDEGGRLEVGRGPPH